MVGDRLDSFPDGCLLIVEPDMEALPGDYVIVTNVEKVVFTGNKWQQKSYQRYSGHPGGQKEEVAWKLLQRRPERILALAVQRMMPKNKIGRKMLKKLKCYAGGAHPHSAQQPKTLEI